MTAEEQKEYHRGRMRLYRNGYANPRTLSTALRKRKAAVRELWFASARVRTLEAKIRNLDYTIGEMRRKQQCFGCGKLAQSTIERAVTLGDGRIEARMVPYCGAC